MQQRVGDPVGFRKEHFLCRERRELPKLRCLHLTGSCRIGALYERSRILPDNFDLPVNLILIKVLNAGASATEAWNLARVDGETGRIVNLVCIVGRNEVWDI